METKLKTARMEVARRRLNFHRYFVVVAKGRKRGLTLMWKKKASVEIYNYYDTRTSRLGLEMEYIKLNGF